MDSVSEVRRLEGADRPGRWAAWDELAVAASGLVMRWAPPAVRDDLWPNTRLDEALDGVA